LSYNKCIYKRSKIHRRNKRRLRIRWSKKYIFTGGGKVNEGIGEGKGKRRECSMVEWGRCCGSG